RESTVMPERNDRARNEAVQVTVIPVRANPRRRMKTWAVGAALIGAVFLFAITARSMTGPDTYAAVQTKTTERTPEEGDAANATTTTSSTTTTTVPVTTTTVFFVAVPEMNLPPEFVPVPEMSTTTTTAKPAARSAKRASKPTFVPVPEGFGSP